MVFPKQKSVEVMDVYSDFLLQHHRQQGKHIQSSYCCLSGLSIVLMAVFLFCCMLQPAETLTCYETVNGKTTIKQNDTWLYCSLVPSTMIRDEQINGTRFGLGPENDGLVAYNAAFGMNEKQYKVLTVCIFERYDFSRFLGLKPDTAVEFAFRCVCNYDLCNSEATFYPFLKSLREESYIVKN